MTGHDHDNDDTANENLGPNEGLDPFFEQGPQKAGKKRNQDGEQTPDESPEDLLFTEPHSSDDESESIGKPGRTFEEGGHSQWAGRGMSPDEIGIPVEGSQSHIENDDELGIDSEQELELIDDENGTPIEETSIEASSDDEIVLDDGVLEDSEAIAEAAEAVASDDDLMGGEVFVLDDGETAANGEPLAVPEDETDTIYAIDQSEEANQDGEGSDDSSGGTLLADEPLPVDSYPVEEGWEPVEEPADDTEVQQEAATEEEQPAEELEPSYSSRQGFEVLEGDAEEPAGESVVLAMAPRRNRAFRLVGSLAAAALVVAAAGVAVLQPEWFGLTLDPQPIDRVQVARPDTAPRVPKPAQPKPDREQPEPEVTPAPLPELPAEPMVETTPDHSEPATTPDVQPPVVPLPIPTEPTPNEPGAQIAAPDLPRYQPVGDTMWIGQFDGRAEVGEQWANVRPGSKAFAQLANGNFFIGSVKGVAKDALVLSVKQGEVSLARNEVTKLTALDSADYFDLQRATTGFLKLSNKNRLVGAILESVVDDQYILQMRSDRIVVPRSAVEEVVQQPGSDNLRFGSLGDEEEWLRQVATRQLQEMRTGKSAGKGLPVRSPAVQEPTSLPLQKTERAMPNEGR